MGLGAGQASPADARIRLAPAGSDDLFTNSVVRHLRIEIPSEGMAELRAYRYRRRRGDDAMDRPRVQATVLEKDTVYTNVALHLKGAAGSFRSVDDKPGFTLNFDKFVEGQLFHGLDKLSLNNSVQDPSFLCEKVCREIFLAAGVPVPRADYATVELNGRWLGLYVLTEGWDRRFLRQYFQDAGGNLYDPGLGRDITDGELPVTCGDQPADQSELEALIAAAREPNPSHRLARLEQRLDFNRFLTFLALEVLLWHWDGYTMNVNNYRVFHDRATGRIVFMPHGLDQMFLGTNGPIVAMGRSLLPRAILQTAEGRRRYLERFAAVRANHFDAVALTNRVRDLAARLRPAILRERLPVQARFNSAVDELCERLVSRAFHVDQQLEGVRQLVSLAPGDVLRLTNWTARRASGAPVFGRSQDADVLHIQLQDRGVGAWFSTVWLEEGRYRIEGRLRTRNVQADITDTLEGAGLRVTSPRKWTDGVDWGWFPLRRGADPRRRAEVQAPGFVPRRLTGTTGWTEVSYRIDLRQPFADLDVLCELRADLGEAWFEADSVRLVREK
jgi:hypothetical protein